MKNKQTYVKVAIIVASVGMILIVIFSMILNKSEENRDPIILKFNEIMYELSSDKNTYHAKEEIVNTDENGIVISEENSEYYNDYTNFLIINDGEEFGKGFHDFVYKGYRYSYSFNAKKYDINKQEQDEGFYARPIISISNSYFTLEDKYISYEETEDGYIFRCNNQNKVGRGYESNGNRISNVCDSAIANIYLDKEWNVLKILAIEEWTQIDEDGIESKSITNISIVFCETSDEEVRKYLDDEYEFLESLLK